MDIVKGWLMNECQNKGIRKSGRPQKRWNNEVEKDLKTTWKRHRQWPNAERNGQGLYWKPRSTMDCSAWGEAAEAEEEAEERKLNKYETVYLCKSVHITLIQVDQTSHVEFYSLFFHVLMNTLLSACVKKDEHIPRDTVKQIHTSIKKISSTVMIIVSHFTAGNTEWVKTPHLQIQMKNIQYFSNNLWAKICIWDLTNTMWGCCTCIAMF